VHEGAEAKQGWGRNFYNRTYSAREAYGILYRGLRTMMRLVKAKRSRELSGESVERIMLAVTEVNGCEVCSYAHARMALEKDLSAEEVRMLLAGDAGAVPADEAIAIAFAQHYAESRGNPTRESWQRLVETYGSAKAQGILAAARAMMIGNAYGIAWSAFVSRLKGRPIAGSRLSYEVVMLFAIIPHLPIALVHAAVSALCHKPIIGWSSIPEDAGL
jgi:AhpD family alkylhydroperoxidase